MLFLTFSENILLSITIWPWISTAYSTLWFLSIKQTNTESSSSGQAQYSKNYMYAFFL